MAKSTNCKKITEKTTVKPTKKPKVGQLIPQPHGGALRYGGTNKGGPGRPTNLAKEMAEEATLEESIPLLKDVVSGKPIRSVHRRFDKDGKELASVYYEQTPEMRDRLKAADLLLKMARPPVTAHIKAAEARLEDAEDRSFTLVLGERSLGEMQDDE